MVVFVMRSGDGTGGPGGRVRHYLQVVMVICGGFRFAAGGQLLLVVVVTAATTGGVRGFHFGVGGRGPGWREGAAAFSW